MRVTFRFREGDIVFAKFIPDVPLEITGVHRVNGGNSYSCFDGENEFIKYENQLFTKDKPKKKIGYKGGSIKKAKQENPSVKEIGHLNLVPIYEDEVY